MKINQYKFACCWNVKRIFCLSEKLIDYIFKMVRIYYPQVVLEEW